MDWSQRTGKDVDVLRTLPTLTPEESGALPAEAECEYAYLKVLHGHMTMMRAVYNHSNPRVRTEE